MGQASTAEAYKFAYEQASDHRILCVDGAWATMTPRGDLQLVFFNDLHRLPDGTDTVDIVREVGVTVVADIVTAKKIADLISYIIEQFDQAGK